MPLLLLPPGTPRSLGFHNTRACLSLYVFSPARAQMSHVSTRSLLPWQSALHWAFLSPFLSPGHSQEQRHLWDPADKGLAAAKQGSWGQGKGGQGQTSCYILSQEPQFRGFFHNHASLGSCRSPGCQGFRFYFGAFFFKYVLGMDQEVRQEKGGQRKPGI